MNLNEISKPNSNVAGLVVTFNPDLPTLKLCLEGLIQQTSNVLVVDNNSDNILNILEIVTYYDVRILRKNENLGLAKALNYGLSELLNILSLEWIILLDQDSVLESNYISDLLSIMKREVLEMDRIWAVRGVEKNDRKENVKKTNHRIKYIKSSIMSASLIRVEALKSLHFRDDFFVDLVDSDFYYQIRKSDHDVLLINGVFFKHQLGKTINMSGRKISYHNGTRIYYIVRNGLILLLEGKSELKLSLVLTFSIFPTIYVEGFKKTVKYYMRGLIDGFKYKVGK